MQNRLGGGQIICELLAMQPGYVCLGLSFMRRGAVPAVCRRLFAAATRAQASEAVAPFCIA